MKVKELIEKLKELDGEREIYYRWEYEIEEIDEINEDAIVKYKQKGYNEFWPDYLIGDLRDYERIKSGEDNDELISKEDIYRIN
jgi:hypothetical protein